jgi:hypothetical protein
MFDKLGDDHVIRRVPRHGLRHTCVSLLLALGITHVPPGTERGATDP